MKVVCDDFYSLVFDVEIGSERALHEHSSVCTHRRSQSWLYLGDGSGKIDDPY